MDMAQCKAIHNDCDPLAPECRDRKELWNNMIGGHHPMVLENHPSFSQMYMCAKASFRAADACEGDSGGG